MRLQSESGTFLFDSQGIPEIASGGEGTIIANPLDRKMVVKIYHQPRKRQFAEHLKWLSGLDGKLFVKPVEVLYTQSGEVAGFTMQYVDLNKYVLFSQLVEKQFCLQNGFDKKFKLKALDNLKKAIELAHSKGITIGDLNQYNIFVGKDASILLMDVDSYGTAKFPHNGVMLDDIRDFRNTAIDEKSDAWSFDILAFWINTFVHPFRGKFLSGHATLMERIMNKQSIIGKFASQVKISPIYEPVDKNVHPQFLEVFEGTRRFMVDFTGASLAIPIQIKPSTASLNSQSLNILQIADGITEFHTCGNLGVYKKNGVFHVLNLSSKGYAINLKQIACDNVFLGSTKFIYQKDNSFFDMNDNPMKGMSSPENKLLHYAEGNLVMLDGKNDAIYVYDIEKQLNGYIQGYSTALYTKSMRYRNEFSQSLGNGVHLWTFKAGVPEVIQVHFAVQQHKNSSNILLIEHIEKGAVKWTFGKNDNLKFRQGAEYTHFANFATQGNLVFITEDKEIVVVDSANAWQPILRMDCPVCETSSTIKITPAGLLVQTNDKVYLLNRK